MRIIVALHNWPMFLVFSNVIVPFLYQRYALLNTFAKVVIKSGLVGQVIVRNDGARRNNV